MPLPRSGSQTIEDAVRVHLRHLNSRVAQGSLKQSTRDYYERMLKHAPKAKLDSLKPSDTEAWQQSLTDKSASTRRGAFIALKAALKTARRDGLTTCDPMADLTVPSGAREREPVHATEQDLQALFQRAPEPWRTLWLVIAYTGLRRGEALALECTDIDLERKYLRVRSGKTERARRTIPLVDDVVDALRRLPSHADQTRIFPYEGRNTYRAFCRHRPRQELTIHGMRHGFVTRLLERNVPMQVVSALAGHSSVTVTMDAYAHSVSDFEREAGQRLVTDHTVLGFQSKSSAE